MSRISNESIVLITSAIERKANVIGTGFAFYRKQGYTYLLTCAHVVEDVGGEGNVVVNNSYGEIIAIGNTQGFDLAVLRIKEPLDIPLLKLKSLEKAKGKKIEIFGHYLFGEAKRPSFEKIKGEVAEKSFLVSKFREGATKKVATWKLKMNKSYLLQKGYSGAPVVDLNTNFVLGVATDMEGNGEKGRAISVEALKEIWPEVPPQIFEHSKNSQISLMYLIYSSLFALFLGFFLGKLPQSFIKHIVCSTKQKLLPHSAIKTCQGYPENPFSVHIINKDGVNIENVGIATSENENFTCNFEGSNVYSCGQISKPIRVSIKLKKIQVPRPITPPPSPSPKDEETNDRLTKPFNLEEEFKHLKITDPTIIKKYKNINELLLLNDQKELGKADEETYFLIFEIMLKSSGLELDPKYKILYPFHIKEIPCKHLSLIDKIWKNASDKKSFSFSYQKKIYQDYEKNQTGKHDRYNSELIEKWGKELGWFDGLNWNDWKKWDELGNNAKSGKTVPKGYFPMGGMFISSGYELDEEVKSLTLNKAQAHAESLKTCELIQP